MILGGGRVQKTNIISEILCRAVLFPYRRRATRSVVPVSSQDCSFTSHLKDAAWKSRAASNIAHEPAPTLSNRKAVSGGLC